jgi:hypothetical protein
MTPRRNAAATSIDMNSSCARSDWGPHLCGSLHRTARAGAHNHYPASANSAATWGLLRTHLERRSVRPGKMPGERVLRGENTFPWPFGPSLLTASALLLLALSQQSC